MNDINYGNISYGGVQNNYGTTKPSPCSLIEKKVAEFILNLNALGHIGKELLAPYIAAFEMGYMPQLTCDEFNSKFQINIKSTTYNNWTSPVFHDIISDTFHYNEHELSYYKTIYQDLIHRI